MTSLMEPKGLTYFILGFNTDQFLDANFAEQSQFYEFIPKAFLCLVAVICKNTVQFKISDSEFESFYKLKKLS